MGENIISYGNFRVRREGGITYIRRELIFENIIYFEKSPELLIEAKRRRIISEIIESTKKIKW